MSGAELQRYGNLPCRTAKSGGSGRPTSVYYLNEPQALLICMKSDAPVAVVTLNASNVPVTNSRDVAAWFGKRHDNVLQSINKVLADGDEDDALNFQAVTYIDAKGETRRAYEMTQTGFVLLAFGFTGKEALKFKKAYIAKFNAMEAELRAIHDAGIGAVHCTRITRHLRGGPTPIPRMMSLECY